MPFGIDLPDIKELPGIDSFTTSDEEKRKRRKRKRPTVPKTAKKKKDDGGDFWSATKHFLTPGAAFEDVTSPILKKVHAPKIIRSIPKNVAQIGEGFIPATLAIGKAGWHDRNLSLLDTLDRKHLQDYMRLAQWTLADEKGDKKKRPKTDSELAGLVAEMIRGWGRGIERAIPDPTNSQDVREAARTWRDDPVFAAMDVLPFGAAVTRPISIGSRVGKLGVRGAIKESYYPGAAARAGLEGGIAPRTHAVQIGDVTREVHGRPWSRNPLMREMQRGYDNLFELSPKLQTKRVARVEERLANEEKRRITLASQELSHPVAHLVYGRLGRALGAFGFKSGMTPLERQKATALAYAFQMPRHMDPHEALGAVQDDLRSVLESGKMELPRGKRVKTADLTREQKQALTTQIADLEAVRRDLRSGDLSEDEFRTALEAMKHTADQTQEMGLDIMRRRYNLTDEEEAALREAWANRADMLPRRLAGRGHLGLDLADSPERAARIAEWMDRHGPEGAQALTALYDGVARGVRGNDPASFYAERVGKATGETPEEYAQRVGEAGLYQRVTPEHGMQSLIEGAAEAPAQTSAFFSPLQKWVDEKMPRKMQAGQLQAVLRREIPNEEFYNLGLDNFFNQYGRNEVLLQAEFQNFLANPLNAYNLREVHFVNTHEADAVGLAARYDIEHQGNYVSRDPAMGEYHEVVMELPNPYLARDKTYRGTGRLHWDRDNVAVHARFHVFDEDGKTKLLIEEIQSDWANDFRKEAARGLKYRDLTEEEAQHFDDLRGAIEEAEAVVLPYQRAVNEAAERARNAAPEERAAADDEFYRLSDERDRAREDLHRLQDEYDALNDDFRLGNVPPPPLGRGSSARSSYINTMSRWLHRYAAENGVDEIIVVSREAQLARNGKSIGSEEWSSLGGGSAEAVTEYLARKGHAGRAYISYDTDIPEALAREMGVDGRRVEDAYDGHYRVPHDFNEQAAGRMPGTVFTMTDEARAAAMKPKSMYQRQPDWDALPKGATEFIEGGHTRVHAFKDADISTWIHELGHIALHDLPDDARAVLEGHYAGGRAVSEWREMEHESFARDFEDYVRKGTAPTNQLASIFGKLSAWVREVWKAEKRKGTQLDPQVEEVFSRMFGHPDPELTKTWGYFPHRDFTELAQQEYRGGVRPPAAGQTIGIPQLAGQTLQRKPNEMLLYQAGRLSPDPKQLVDVFMRRLRFQETLNARDELWSMGRPLSEQPPKGAWLIRNPDEAAQRIRPEVQAAVRGRPTTAPSRTEDLEALEGQLTGDAEQVRQEMIAKPGEHPEWASDEENVRWVPEEYVTTRFGEVFEQRPRGGMWSALGLMNSLQRTTGIYGRPISYVGGNVPFNVMALMASMPVSTLRNAGKTFRLMRGSDEQRALYRAIASETGETRASGGLPDFYVQAQNRLQGAEQKATQAQRAAADVLSKAADSPWRVTAFLNNARKRGFRTDDQLRDLIREGGPELSDIRQLTREQLLDFDTLNPTQRRLASQFLYLWPFMYASVKWPMMFAREYPGRAALAAEFMQDKGQNEPASIANLWKSQGIDLSTFNPVGPAADIAEQLQLTLQDPGQMDLTVLQDRLSPTLASLVESMSGGKKNAVVNYLRQSIPGAAELISADPQFRGGKQYADQSRAAYLLQRHTRFFPRGLNPEVIKERIDKFRSDHTTADTHELERNADWQKIERYYKTVGGDGDAIRRSYKAWWDYQEAVAEKKDATGQRKLTTLQSIEVLTGVAEENYPELEGQLWDVERMRDSDYQRKNAKAMEEYAQTLKDYINDARSRLFSDYSYATP